MLQNRISQQMVILFVLLVLGLSGCAPAAQAPNAAGPVAPQAPASVAKNQVAQVGELSSGGLQRQIVAKATIILVVQDTQQTVDRMTALIAQHKGYVANANLYKSNDDGVAILQGTLTLRVPSDQTDQTLQELEALALDVSEKSVSREDVTDQYADVDAQLRNLTATETELRALLAEVRAKPNAKPDDILAVHQRLTEIRGQIDQLQGRKNVLDNLINLATIDVTLTPNALNQPATEAGWQPVAVVHSALRTLVSTLQMGGTVAIWLGLYVIPILLILLAVFGALFWVIRFCLRRLVWVARFCLRYLRGRNQLTATE